MSSSKRFFVIEFLYSSDEHGFTLLHWAAWYGRLSAVQLLLQRGARVNAVNRGEISLILTSFNLFYEFPGDDTPLHLAVSHNHFDIVQHVSSSFSF